MSAELDIAERLDRALARPGSPVDLDVSPLLVLAARVRGMSRVQPSEGFVDALDRQLRRQAEARRRALPKPTRAPLFTGLRQLAKRSAAIAAVTAALMLAGWGTVQAAHGSLPGHPLYGLKRALEAIELASLSDPGAQAAFHSNLMSERFQEAIALAEAGQDVPPGLLAEASGSLGAALGIHDGLPPEDRGDVAQHLMDVFARQKQRLDDMLLAPPGESSQGLERALQAVVDRMARFEGGMPGQGPPDGVTLGPPHDVPVGGPFGLDAEADIALIKEARAAQREAQRNERRVSQIAAQYDASDAEIWAIYEQCDQDWKCVRKYFRDLERENQGKGRPANAGSEGQKKPEEPPGPPFDDGPPGPPGDGPPGAQSSHGPP